jgi:hypothetical protein
MLRPRERRRPAMPNQLPQVVEERIVAFALGHPGLGPKRIAAMLARPEWGGLIVSPNGVYKALRRHGLSTRAKRLSLIAGYRAPYEPPRTTPPEPHITTTQPGGLVGNRLLLRRTASWHQGRRLAAHRDRHLLELRVGRAGALRRPRSRPGPDQPFRAARRAHPAPRRLAPGARAHRQRRRIPKRLSRRDRGARRPPDQDPRRPPRPTATSNACTARSSKNAGAPPSRAFSTCATAACNANATPTSTSTTTTAPTPDASPRATPPQSSSTVPAR